MPSCGATLDYMLDVFPLLTVVRKVLTGGGECAKIDWSLLGLSMPGWVLVAVVAAGRGRHRRELARSDSGAPQVSVASS